MGDKIAKCGICGKLFEKYRPQSKYCSDECRNKGFDMKYSEWVQRKKEEGNHGRRTRKAVIKKKSVCKGCKYHIEKCQYHIFNGTCDYLTQTGHSRIVVEMEQGGVKADSCPCYEAGTYKEVGRQPIRIRKVR